MRHLVSIIFAIALLGAGATDTDGDGLLDSEEDKNGNGVFDVGETDYLNADTDGGGEADGTEVQFGRDPLDADDDYTTDSDGDGLHNGEEARLGINPNDEDTDGDGISDKDDPFPLDKKYKSDIDSDGIPDEYEDQNNLSKNNPQDATQDPDGDGIQNRDEFIIGTDPNNEDTDKDGTPDGDEITEGTDPQENPCLEYGGGSAHFADLEEHWSTNYVYHLHQTRVQNRRIIQGYTEANRTFFLPDRPITRFELLKIALLSSCTPLVEETSSAVNSFTDVPNSARPNESSDRKERRQVVYTAVAKGIVEGYEDGSFRPDEHINRAEAMKVLLLAAKPEILHEPYGNIPDFSDVTGDEWFGSYVKLGNAYSIVDGFPDGSFRPGHPITRAEASKVVLLLMVTNPRVNGYIIPLEDF